ncbi:MAG: hypothetical protein JRJ73_16335 [Deltaproteobacteria bacterium]|nr:hypothetical protein [Deltaproteobacteria bacterium]
MGSLHSGDFLEKTEDIKFCSEGMELLICVDHLIPGMELDSDVRLQAGSFLITRKDLPDARLNEKVIESLQKFGNQLAPEKNRISVKADELTLNHLKSVLEEDIYRETFDLMACMAFILSEVSFLDYLVFLLRNISFFEQ